MKNMKNMRKTIKIMAFLLLSHQSLALAEEIPQSLSVDHRVKIVTYDPDNVTLLRVHYGYATDIVFSPNETASQISLGDSLAWQAVPVANHLFLKPVASSNTNMTVLTNLHSYNFQLVSSNSPNPYDQIYELKYIYPDEDPSVASYGSNNLPAGCNPTQCNWEYSFIGDKQIAPIQAFDNNQFTYFKFRNDGNSDIPAIFIVDKNRNETLVDYHMENGYIVVNRVANQFTFRNGKYVACIFNDAAIGDWNKIH